MLAFDFLVSSRWMTHRPKGKKAQGQLWKSPVKNKRDSVHPRSNRIGKEGNAVRNADEIRRRKLLFECVRLIH